MCTVHAPAVKCGWTPLIVNSVVCASWLLPHSLLP